MDGSTARVTVRRPSTFTAKTERTSSSDASSTAPAASGVVYQYVNPSETFQGSGRRGLRLTLHGDIQLNGQQIVTGAQRATNRFRIASGRNYRVPAIQRCPGDLQPETARRSRNKPNL
jgi:hypothetical protein